MRHYITEEDAKNAIRRRSAVVVASASDEHGKKEMRYCFLTRIYTVTTDIRGRVENNIYTSLKKAVSGYNAV